MVRNTMRQKSARGAYQNDNASNKSLDASGGSVFRIMTGPAVLD
jgi:hypothetical protein